MNMSSYIIYYNISLDPVYKSLYILYSCQEYFEFDQWSRNGTVYIL